MTNKPKHVPSPFLDEILETPEAAQWLKLNPRVLLAESQGENPKIPAIRINERVIRFNRRIILAKFAHDAGLPPEVIAAAFVPSVQFPQTTTERSNEPNNQN